MQAALILNADGTVLARWEDPDATDLPTAPEDCAYVAVTANAFDALETIFRADGHLAWRIVLGELVPRLKPGTRPFIAICNSTTRAVVALDRGIPSFLRPGFEAVAISESDFGAIDELRSLDPNDFVPAWDCAADGTVTARTDDRAVLRVSFSGEAVVGAPFTIDFQAENAQGDPLSVSGQRPIVVTLNGHTRKVDLMLVDGQASVQRTFQEAGSLTISSADPQTYRVAGQTLLAIVESW